MYNSSMNHLLLVCPARYDLWTDWVEAPLVLKKRTRSPGARSNPVKFSVGHHKCESLAGLMVPEPELKLGPWYIIHILVSARIPNWRLKSLARFARHHVSKSDLSSS